MTIEPFALLAWLAWGTLVGVDFVTVPQGLLSRPIVAASVTGLLLGDPGAGLVVGMTLELYALDVLPIGAARYPDFGIAAVAAAAAAAHSPAEMAPALAGLVGLPMAMLGGWSLQRLRRRNAVSVVRRFERVAAGDARAIWELQRNGFVRDGLRSLAVTVVGVDRGTADHPHPLERSPAHRTAVLGRRRRRTGRSAERSSAEFRRRRPAALARDRTRARHPRGADPVKPRAAALLRLYGVQAAWTYERMSGIGVGHAAAPMLREHYAASSVEARRAAVARSAEFFNSHPYLAGIAVGAVVKAERDGVPGPVISRLRTALSGPLGAIGDQLIWAG